MKLRKYPRAGDAGDNMLVLEGADTIDVSPIDTSLLGYSYLTTKPVFQDPFELLHPGTDSGERCKLAVRCYRETLKWKKGLDYWRFLSVGQ